MVFFLFRSIYMVEKNFEFQIRFCFLFSDACSSLNDMDRTHFLFKCGLFTGQRTDALFWNRCKISFLKRKDIFYEYISGSNLFYSFFFIHICIILKSFILNEERVIKIEHLHFWDTSLFHWNILQILYRFHNYQQIMLVEDWCISEVERFSFN